MKKGRDEDASFLPFIPLLASTRNLSILLSFTPHFLPPHNNTTTTPTSTTTSSPFTITLLSLHLASPFHSTSTKLHFSLHHVHSHLPTTRLSGSGHPLGRKVVI
ncbi:hypothetical protein Pmani_031481 [Petrolisthes manimaculis]|uniref:Uncharacterized protein n=1 Tax=Petrolisthes manimaculis TaxID=1843537 RepID=A0AAE1NV31_9EUCA|nr:hypothetical protein Pmani_031481 [Petrolisthes manimaculis]